MLLASPPKMVRRSTPACMPCGTSMRRGASIPRIARWFRLAAESRAAAARAFLDHDDDGRLWSSVCGKRRRAFALDRSCWPAAGLRRVCARHRRNIAALWPARLKALLSLITCFSGEKYGWGGRIRTSAWRNQNPLPYRLATPQCVVGLPPGAAGSVRNITAHARTINVGPARALMARPAADPWACTIP